MASDKAYNAKVVELQQVTNELSRLRFLTASQAYLSEGKDAIFALFVKVHENFDGSEYQQGKKDGLRTALALLGDVEMADFNRGQGKSRDDYGHIISKAEVAQ